MIRADRFSVGYAFILAAATLFLAGCIVQAAPAARVDGVTSRPVRVTPGETVGQSFRSPGDNLSRLDLYVGSWDETAEGFYFVLQSQPDSEEVLARVYVMAEVASGGLASVTFPPLKNSGGNSFYFEIQPQSDRVEHGFNVFVTTENAYQQGTAYFNGEPINGDLLFIAYTAEHYTLSRLSGQLWSRIGRDNNFFTFYGLLLALNMLALGVIIYHTSRGRDEQS